MMWDRESEVVVLLFWFGDELNVGLGISGDGSGKLMN